MPIIGTDSHVSFWIARLKKGDGDAARHLWSRYSERLYRLARVRLHSKGRMPTDRDEEDIVLSAFYSFCKGVDRGRFPDLNDRGDFWRLLAFIIGQKVHDCRRYHQTQGRDGARTERSPAGLDGVPGREHDPEFAAIVAEECHRLLGALDDDTLRQIAVWKMEGFRNEEIGVKLGVCLKTVSNKLKLIRMIWQPPDGQTGGVGSGPG